MKKLLVLLLLVIFVASLIPIEVYSREAVVGEQTNLDKAKTRLNNALDKAITKLQNFKSKVENRKVLEQTDKDYILSKIDEHISYYEGKKDEVNSAATIAELRVISKEIKSKWAETRRGMKWTAGFVLNVHVKTAIEKGEKVSARVQAKIDELKSQGKDTSELEAWLADFNAKLEDAKKKYEAAKEKFRSGEIDTREEAEQFIREGHAYIKEARQYIKEAKAQLRKIVAEMKKDKYAAKEETDSEVDNLEETIE